MPPVHLPHRHGQPVEEFCAGAPSVEEFQTVADVFKQLGDATRVRIFWLLCHGEECVINISALMEMSSPAVSHHLRSLKSAGLIVSRREGKEVYYKAAASETAAMLHRAIEELMSMACPCARRRGGNG
ncbi:MULTISPECIES: ArsR/SmtB family transcription factor [unclassified Pyramidobacter]|uniref:ArsR/SmtB family transcription factor n=1 Tax=unclassified Pyramidobacter TaxID=2632171 RepID=UPI000EA318C7|nr:metalloregulator ArsR/SmtB family transcription factor [Pyramidobacter sp. CG50-2]RKJ81334.1 ArsR family transcriptional regulator [Pyramidobacter sp. CG50-2]